MRVIKKVVKDSRGMKKPRYKPELRATLLEEYNQRVAQGQTQTAIVEDLGVSIASIYRWQYAIHPSIPMPLPTRSQRALSISDAIARLALGHPTDKLEFLEALFKLIIWMRWPASNVDHPAAMTICIASYISQGSSAESLSELPPAELQLILRNFRVDTLKRLFSTDSLGLPLFESYKIRDQNYDPFDFYSDICWFLIAYKSNTRKARDLANLGEAYYASQNGTFRFQWKMSESVFRKEWSKHGVASPFLYVERFHSNLYWTISPLDEGFAQSVDDLMSKPEAIRVFLARCRAAVELLRSRLHPLALAKMHFPTFPSTLAAEPITPPALSDRVAGIMSGY